MALRTLPAFGLLLTLNDDIGGSQCRGVFFSLAFIDEGFELGQRGAKYFNVVFKFGLNSLDEFGQLVVERVCFINRITPAN